MNAAFTTNDIQLHPSDIGQLENADQVVHFFARLGYDVDDSTPLDHANLGLDTEELKLAIRHIRFVGQGPDEEIKIYLFEVRSVTVLLTQQIARRFRNRPENPLLVLTSDYEKLDFVLVEKELGASKKLGGGMKQIIRPRSITVNRRNPSRVHLRVLSRFTYTEADDLYQWEKLRSAFTLAEWTEEHFNNRALFSDYYLKARLTDPKLTPEWAEDVSRIARDVHRCLANARTKYSAKKESVIRKGLYEPLFKSLGFQFSEEKAGDSDLAEPDYLLYDPDHPDKPIAAALTYVWNRNLDDEDPQRDKDTPQEIPGALVVNVLAKAEVDWVAVTNGKLWRLYSTTASNKATNYYEVDLEEALHAPDQLTAFKYWWLFFRRQAFTGFLNDLLQKSSDYAKELGDRLKDRVFTEIFPYFARGFIADMRANGDQDISQDDLNRVYGATMTFLYRLMFILYAESLELLPVYEARGYGEFSLYRLKKMLAEKAGDIEDDAPDRLKKAFSEDERELYEQLQLLFHAIDTGDEKLNLPMYNGGLFSDETEEGRFLARHAIPDRYLALGLDRLCRDVDDKTQALAFIDFKSLGVRQLGSIYEGLLEFKLRIAAEDLVVVKEKKKEVYLPAKKAGRKKAQARLPKGSIYLENDKRERKATGSYYTPDYIVKYIVEHTVGPVLERKFEALTPRLREAQKRYRQHKKRVEARGNDQPPELFWNREEMRQLADDCLDIKVLDPAMGSGHFLVEAVDFISNRLIEFLNAWSENPVWAMLERTRQDILEDMERQGVTIDAEKLTRVALLKRSVLKRCIYGVDLNPMAVELAKVSLWLDAFTLGAPLSFLDHHLKCGNSLIGARISEVKAALEDKPGRQLGLFAQSKFAGVMLATDLMRQVSYLSDNTAGQLQQSRTAFRSARDHLAPYKRVLDVYTSRWFGNHPNITKKDAFDPVVEFLQRDDVEAWLRDPENVELPEKDYMEVRKIGEIALRVAAEKRFFHWELEFPEVFFAPSSPGGQDVQLREDGGFDAVVGNPPFNAKIDASQVGFIDTIANKSGNGRLDTAALFVENASDYLKQAGKFAFLLPHRLLSRKRDFGKHQQYIYDNLLLFRILYLGQVPEFDAKDEYMIGIFQPGYNGDIEVSYGDNLGTDLRYVHFYHIPRILWGPPDYLFNIYLPELSLQIILKLENNSIRLGDIAESKDGIVVFIRDKLLTYEQIDERYVPFVGVSGQYALRKWEMIIYEKMYLCYDIEEAKKYILDKKELRKVQFRDRAIFERREKIITPQDSTTIRATVDRKQLFHSNSLHSTYLHDGVHYSIEYIAAILNCPLTSYYYRKLNLKGIDLHPQILVTNLAKLPIRRIDFEQYDTSTRDLEESIWELYTNQRYDDLFAKISLLFNGHPNVIVHNLITRFGKEMLRLVEAKQLEVSRFLLWLESMLRIRPDKSSRAGINSLIGKTIILNYSGDPLLGRPEVQWPAFLYQLHQNRRRFGVNLDDVKGEIQAEYEKSLAILLPIKRQLAHTDALIDQIVYKLYGLTDEEIAIIERPAYEKALSEAKAAVVENEKLQADPEAAAEVMAEAIRPAAERLVTHVPLSQERQTLDRELPGWHLFHDEVKTFLLTAEYNLNTMPDQLDFSTSIIAYTKAVERMLYHRLFIPFRKQGATPENANNRFLKEFLEGKRKLTLGSMNIILPSSRETALRAYINRLYPDSDQRFFGPDGVVDLLNDPVSLELRNAAAHDQTLSKEDARQIRAWAFDILRKL